MNIMLVNNSYIIKGGIMDFITTSEAAKKWCISARRVAILCAENRISGVAKIGKTWLIPKNAEKPFDKRQENVPPKRKSSIES